MKKIAIVNQRYGSEVNGGSEVYARTIAEHLAKYYQVEVITTTALDYDSWDNYYPAGTTDMNGIQVIRFPVEKTRNMLRFRIVSKLTRIFSKFGIHLDKLWLKEQGPYAPQALDYLSQNASKYEKILFVTYLYYLTAQGLPLVKEKSILIPTAHDEPYIHFPIYKSIFQNASAMIYLTEEEKEFVHRTFHNEKIPHDVIALGIDVPDHLNDPNNRKLLTEEFRNRHQIHKPYLIYAGRVDYGKKCDEMFEYFLNFKKTITQSDLQLVIIGKTSLEIPKHPDIHYLGFVSEEEKYTAIAGARYLWLPSEFESLSISLLEGMALGVPGIVNGKCEVLLGHANKSHGAFFYRNQEEFMSIIEQIDAISSAEYKDMCASAQEYVKKNYLWDVIEGRLGKMIDRS